MLKKIIAYITHDPVRKIFALIFAFGLWIYVAIGNNYSYQRGIRIVYTNLPDSFIIVDSISNIDVNFSGRGGALFSIWAAPPKAQCDLRNKATGKITISPQELKIPVGYSPVRIDYNTSAFSVEIDKRIVKEMKIRVPIKGTPKQGYAVDDIWALDTVYVVGPQRMLTNVSELNTETLIVRNRSSSFQKELRVEKPSSLFIISRRSVNVMVKIDQTIQRTLTYVPLILLYSPNQVVRADKSYLDTLVVIGTPRRIKNLSLNDIEIKINLTKLGPGDYNLPAEVLLPEYLTPVYSVPRKFNIQIEQP
jgi:YbbR domain-containing protein